MSIDLPSELTLLRRSILEMCSEIELRLDQALKGLFQKKKDPALEVRHGDKDVNEMEMEIEMISITVQLLEIQIK